MKLSVYFGSAGDDVFGGRRAVAAKELRGADGGAPSARGRQSSSLKAAWAEIIAGGGGERQQADSRSQNHSLALAATNRVLLPGEN
jgi:hypothetical protein